MTERDIFIEAVQRTDPADCMAYLEGACAGDEELRRRVDQLPTHVYGALRLFPDCETCRSKVSAQLRN